MGYQDRVDDGNFDFLLGAKITEVRGATVGSEEVVIFTDRGRLVLFHIQDCCESVSVEEVHGDPQDLGGAVITLFDESENAPENEAEYNYESATWTFYRLCTNKGDLTLRWLGVSNGYYSEYVSVEWFPS